MGGPGSLLPSCVCWGPFRGDTPVKHEQEGGLPATASSVRSALRPSSLSLGLSFPKVGDSAPGTGSVLFVSAFTTQSCSLTAAPTLQMRTWRLMLCCPRLPWGDVSHIPAYPGAPGPPAQFQQATFCSADPWFNLAGLGFCEHDIEVTWCGENMHVGTCTLFQTL